MLKIVLLVLSFFPLLSFSQESIQAERILTKKEHQVRDAVQKQAEYADYLIFKTKRGPKELGEALKILTKLNQEEDSRIQKEKESSKQDLRPVLRKNIQLGLDYSYALYFKAAYTYPREDELDGKDFIDERMEYYKLAEKVAEEILVDDIKNQQKKAELLLTLGLVKGEIAAITSSLFLVMDAKKLLEQALLVDGRVRNGAIYLGLGRLYSKTPRILFGSKEKSLEYLHQLQKIFKYPNIVSYYFEAEAILDGQEFKDLKTLEEKKSFLTALWTGLHWEEKRKKKVTPEEVDALKMIRKILVDLDFPTNLRALQNSIQNLMDI